ncbi:MAG: UDP-N-acetylglucosamine acyltransferase, partial [Pirellulaceae bacterium]
MPTDIASNADVHPSAEIGEDVRIGPFCCIGPHAIIGRGTRLENNVTVMGRTTIGEYNRIFPGAVIGGEPQDVSYRGSDTRVVIGDHNMIREMVTINRGSEKEAGITSIGNKCYLMTGAHIAHDCRISDHVIIANNTMLGGHVHIHDNATLSGGIGVHHFATIGSYSFVSGLSRVLQDVPPYMLVDGIPARPRCVNVVALKRSEMDADVIGSLTSAYKLIYRSKVGLDQAREILRAEERLLPQ